MVTVAIKKRPEATLHAVERKCLAQAAFTRDYIGRSRPVVLSDATAGWAARSWTPEILAARFGDRKMIVAYGKQWRKMPLQAFVQASKQLQPVFRRSGPSRYSLYIRNRHIGVDFPELLGDFVIPRYFIPNWLATGPRSREMPFSGKGLIEFFLGHPGATGPSIHQDTYHTHAWVSQLYGRKKVWMAAPDASWFYPDPEKPTHSLLNDFEFPDRGLFPKFDPNVVVQTVLEPGETLFIPAGWWHTAECETTSISLSGNFVNRSNWSNFSGSFCLPSQRKPGARHRVFNSYLLGWHGLACRFRERVAS